MLQKKNLILPLFFSFINLIVCHIVLIQSRNSLILYYKRSIYDIYIENVLKTDMGCLLTKIHHTIMFSCLFIILLCLVVYNIGKKKNTPAWLYSTSKGLFLGIMLITNLILAQYTQKVSVTAYTDINLYMLSARFYLFSCGLVIGAGAAQIAREHKKRATSSSVA